MDNISVANSLTEALIYMVNESRRSSSKGKMVQQWFKDSFDTVGTTGMILDNRQTGNRIVEQFKHRAAHVIFLYDASINPNTIIKKIMEQQYRELESVLLIKYITNEQFQATHLAFLCDSAVTDFYRHQFTGLIVTQLGDLRQDNREEVRAEGAPSPKKYWVFAPGENASKWDEFHEYGIIGIAWDELGDLSQYPSKESMKAKMREVYGEDLSYTNAGHATWQFVHEINQGDIVYAKRGLNKIIGRGEVESAYIFDDTRAEYKNIRRIRWTHYGEWDHEGQIVMKTLTNITPYTDYCRKLEQLFDLSADDVTGPGDVAITYPPYTREDFLQDVFMSSEQYDTLKGLLLKKKNIIMQGAPGVGKTYAAEKLAFSIMGEKDTSRVRMVQFHQSYSYEDFLMGYRPDGGGFSLTKGPFYEFCKRAEPDDRDYFFIIDEINRSNLSKVFGELLMLIETDKRGDKHSIRLLYSDEQFFVPSNVHIIGMMNTADRSLAMIDYALRRRFAFYNLEPAFKSEGFKKYVEGINNPKFAALVEVILSLNDAITVDASLGKGFCIGHSYFCVSEETDIDDAWLSEVVEYELIPLIREYWFDEPSNVEHWEQRLRGAIHG